MRIRRASRCRAQTLNREAGSGCRKRWWRGALLLFTTAWLAVTWAAPVGGQSVDSASEQSIKAAYLYKFTDYVEWPPDVLEDPDVPLTIGVMADDRLAGVLESMTLGRVVRGRSIAVRRVAPREPLDGMHVLFIGSAGTAELPDLAAAARQHAVLVVTETGNALQNGSVINFRPLDQRIRFEVSLDSADRAGLKLSARLLAVALHVEPRQH